MKWPVVDFVGIWFRVRNDHVLHAAVHVDVHAAITRMDTVGD